MWEKIVITNIYIIRKFLTTIYIYFKYILHSELSQEIGRLLLKIIIKIAFETMKIYYRSTRKLQGRYLTVPTLTILFQFLHLYRTH